MSFDNKVIGHLVVRIPVSRRLDLEEDPLNPVTYFSFEAFELLSESIAIEYRHQLLSLFKDDNRIAALLGFIDTDNLAEEIRESLEHRIAAKA